MAKQLINNVKLGVFVITGVLILVIALYMLGRDQSLFTSSFRARARFHDAEGLLPGSNVRYSGIVSGTVKEVRILNDTTIEVSMLINEKIRPFLRKNSIASIGTEGLMGNKVLNIVPNKTPAALIENNDLLYTISQKDLTAAMETLYKTNDNVSIAAEGLVQTIKNINNSPVLWSILNDTSLALHLHASLQNIKEGSVRLNQSAAILETTIQGIKKGDGTIGLLLSDDSTRATTKRAIENINNASAKALTLMEQLDSVGNGLNAGMKNKNGVVYTLLQDTAVAGQLARSMSSIESGTAAFNEDMAALQHNIFTRGYFRKKEKAAKKAK